MTRKADEADELIYGIPIGTPVAQEEAAQQCDLCGVIAELRPYGPNGEAICFDCGMKDEEATKRGFLKAMGWNGANDASTPADRSSSDAKRG